MEFCDWWIFRVTGECSGKAVVDWLALRGRFSDWLTFRSEGLTLVGFKTSFHKDKLLLTK